MTKSLPSAPYAHLPRTGKIGAMRIVVKDEPTTRWPFDRRLFGVVAFACALITMIALPGIVGRNIAGGAVRGEVPAAPEEGMCREVLSSPAQSTGMVDLVGVVPCDQPHSGEIVLVGTVDSQLYPTDPTNPQGVLDLADQRCTDTVSRFVSGVRSEIPLARIEPRARARVTLPSTVQWAYGQRWFSCQVMPATDSYPIAWTGTAHLAAFNRPPSPFATCADGVDGQPVPCQLPHTSEQLTWNDSPNDGDGPGCFPLVGRILTTKDPTFGGTLAVVGHKRQIWTECWVTTTAGQKITGTLIDHGTGPLPLS